MDYCVVFGDAQGAAILVAMLRVTTAGASFEDAKLVGAAMKTDWIRAQQLSFVATAPFLRASLSVAALSPAEANVLRPGHRKSTSVEHRKRVSNKMLRLGAYHIVGLHSIN